MSDVPEIEVTDEMLEAFFRARTSISGIAAALAVSPLRKRVKELEAENERLRGYPSRLQTAMAREMVKMAEVRAQWLDQAYFHFERGGKEWAQGKCQQAAALMREMAAALEP